jgi:hypothetical protein
MQQSPRKPSYLHSNSHSAPSNGSRHLVGMIGRTCSSGIAGIWSDHQPATISDKQIVAMPQHIV